MFLAQLILANKAISMIIGLSIVILALTAYEVHDSGFNKKALDNLTPSYQLYGIACVLFMIFLH